MKPHEFRTALHEMAERHAKETGQSIGTAVSRLNGLAQIRATVDTMLWEQVAAARESGTSWGQIGEELGVSKQAAQQRFGA